MMRFLTCLILAAFGLSARALEAQEIYRTGRGTPRLDARLDEILSDRSFRALTHDTVIARADTLVGPILALGNRLVIEGTVRGTLAIVDANVYARPGARIEGDVINIGGGFYHSELAVISGSVSDHPLAPYHVEIAGDSIVIVGDTEHRIMRLALRPPLANRVDGLRPYLGVRLSSPPMGRYSVEVEPWAAYGLAREWDDGWQGGAELRLRRGLSFLALGGERTTTTNDDWNRSDLANTAAFLWNGRDFRNYYDARRGYVTLARDLIRDRHQAVLSLRGQKEKAYSLAREDTWVLFKPDTFRFNPPINEGTITSGILRLAGRWTGELAAARYDGRVETGQADLQSGTADFTGFFVSGLWAMRALANHTLQVGGYGQGPLGSDSLPRQRWSILGGSGTLHTFRIGRFQGDRVVFVRTVYTVPLSGLIRLPYIGSPNIELFDHIGMAWTQFEEREFQQEVGMRLAFPLFYAHVYANTNNLSGARYSMGVSVRRRAYPWEQRSESSRLR